MAHNSGEAEGFPLGAAGFLTPGNLTLPRQMHAAAAVVAACVLALCCVSSRGSSIDELVCGASARSGGGSSDGEGDGSVPASPSCKVAVVAPLAGDVLLGPALALAFNVSLNPPLTPGVHTAALHHLGDVRLGRQFVGGDDVGGVPAV